MIAAHLTIEGVVTLSWSRYHDTPKLERELPDAYEQRTWMNRMHVTDDGYVFIPPTALKNCLAEAAKYLSMQIPGKGKATFTKHFEAGVLVQEPLILPVKAKDVESTMLFVPATGKRGDGRRVKKWFPVIPSGWNTESTVFILDEIISREVFQAHLAAAGQLIGMGFFRPRNNGFWGRFKGTVNSWEKAEF